MWDISKFKNTQEESEETLSSSSNAFTISRNNPQDNRESGVIEVNGQRYRMQRNLYNTFNHLMNVEIQHDRQNEVIRRTSEVIRRTREEVENLEEIVNHSDQMLLNRRLQNQNNAHVQQINAQAQQINSQAQQINVQAQQITELQNRRTINLCKIL